jgi:hypothetical protein
VLVSQHKREIDADRTPFPLDRERDAQAAVEVGAVGNILIDAA